MTPEERRHVFFMRNVNRTTNKEEAEGNRDKLEEITKYVHEVVYHEVDGTYSVDLA